jgi:hypothetical protein
MSVTQWIGAGALALLFAFAAFAFRHEGKAEWR